MPSSIYPPGSGVYAITNTLNDRAYIGRGPFRRRWPTHRYLLNKGNHHCRELQADWVRYGADVFVFSVLETIPWEPFSGYERTRERFYIFQASNAYNADVNTIQFRAYKKENE